MIVVVPKVSMEKRRDRNASLPNTNTQTKNLMTPFHVRRNGLWYRRQETMPTDGWGGGGWWGVLSESQDPRVNFDLIRGRTNDGADILTGQLFSLWYHNRYY